jgi:hypothetical protein
MNSLVRSFVVGLTAFLAGAAGMLLASALPEPALADAKGLIAAMVGLVGLLLALVLGLLVGAAFGVFTKQQSDAYSLAQFAIEIDRAHLQFGEQGKVGRAHLRSAVARTRARFFGDVRHGPAPFTLEEMISTFAAQDQYFDGLEPATDKLRRHLDRASDLARKYQDTQMLMARQLASPFPPHLVNIMIYWASVLFLGNGLVAKQSAISAIVLLAGAVAIASAIFLILELSNPYVGVIRLSPASFDQLLGALAESHAETADPPRSVTPRSN